MQTNRAPKKISVYAPIITERLEYTLRFVLKDRLGLHYDLSDNWDAASKTEATALVYGDPAGQFEGVHIPSSGILSETDVRIERKHWFLKQASKKIYRDGRFGSDMLGMVFFLISRYETWLVNMPDRHSRFSARSSVLHEKKWIERPVVDEWIRQLGKALGKGQAVELKGQYNFLSTVDVDFPWLYKYRRPFWRWLFKAKKILRGERTDRWSKVRKGEEPDPYDTYDLLKQMHEKAGVRPVFFFHLGEKVTRFDRTGCYDRDAYENLIREIADWAEPAIHPSYYSSERPELIRNEKERLERITGRSIMRSRQHFLRVKMPITYRGLHDAGIGEDHSTGFASRPGFTAGTCAPFYFFDLGKNEATELVLYGLHLMDRSMKQYLTMEPEQAVGQAIELVETVRRYKGTFSLLWHNSSLSDIDGWEEWRAVYEKLLSHAAEGSAQFPILTETA